MPRPDFPTGTGTEIDAAYPVLGNPEDWELYLALHRPDAPLGEPLTRVTALLKALPLKAVERTLVDAALFRLRRDAGHALRSEDDSELRVSGPGKEPSGTKGNVPMTPALIRCRWTGPAA